MGVLHLLALVLSLFFTGKAQPDLVCSEILA